jgi:hypothetical protein
MGRCVARQDWLITQPVLSTRNMHVHGHSAQEKPALDPGERSHYLPWIKRDLRPWAKRGIRQVGRQQQTTPPCYTMWGTALQLPALDVMVPLLRQPPCHLCTSPCCSMTHIRKRHRALKFRLLSHSSRGGSR